MFAVMLGSFISYFENVFDHTLFSKSFNQRLKHCGELRRSTHLYKKGGLFQRNQGIVFFEKFLKGCFFFILKKMYCSHSDFVFYFTKSSKNFIF